MALVRLDVKDRPDDLAGVSNGALPESLLVTVHPAGRMWSSDKLHHLTARKWRVLTALAAERHGIVLSYTGNYRTLARQTDLFRERYRRGQTAETGTERKWWQDDPQGPAWWWKLRGVATAAVPGTSNHGWGGAVDMAMGWRDDPKLGLVAAGNITDDAVTKIRPIVLKCGMSWELQSEPWHIRDVTGDEIPQTVRDYELSLIDPTDPPIPPVSPEETSMAVLVQPSDGDIAVLILDGTVAQWVAEGDAVADLQTVGAVLPTVRPIRRTTLRSLRLQGPAPIYPATYVGPRTTPADFGAHEL